MAATRKIVILGASFAGLSISHYIAKHILPKLKGAKDFKYELHLVDESTHFWWHIAAPRELTSVQKMKHEQCFYPIMDCFKQYPDLKDSIIFHHGRASGLNTPDRKVEITLHQGGSETLEYYAVVIATGIRSPTPLTTLHGDYTISQKALEEMNTKIANAKDIVIGGGGPIGVESAGEMSTHLNGKAKITLITGSDKLLPLMSRSRATKAQKMLEKAGVSVKYNLKVTGSEPIAEGKTKVILDNGESMDCDVYLPAAGVQPNTDFLPADLKTDKGFVNTNSHTFRVDSAGTRVYAAGDVSGIDGGSLLRMFEIIPVLGANIGHDLLADAKAGTMAERSYTPNYPETQLVPIGKSGVGAFNGFGLPGFMVAMVG